MEKEIIKQIVFNEKTGEILAEEILFNFVKDKKISKKILSDILLDKDLDKEYKIKKILQYLFCLKQANFNKNNILQIVLKDNFKYIKSIDKKIIEELKSLSIYIIKLYSIADEFNYCLKINRQTPCKCWEDIYKAIGLKNIISQQKFKTFCEKNNIVRIITIDKYINNNKIKDKFYYFNPNYKKNSIFVSDFVLWLYKDIIKENNSVNEFVVDLLKLKYE